MDAEHNGLGAQETTKTAGCYMLAMRVAWRGILEIIIIYQILGEVGGAPDARSAGDLWAKSAMIPYTNKKCWSIPITFPPIFLEFPTLYGSKYINDTSFEAQSIYIGPTLGYLEPRAT